jgi:hypothetical protein
MISAMTSLIALLVIAAVPSIVTIRLLAHDGRGPQRPPTSHRQDPFGSPWAV